ncbi:MAG: 3-methyl-2-oxobutanoate hydroxymethyltransferase [Rubrivivax sp.]
MTVESTAVSPPADPAALYGGGPATAEQKKPMTLHRLKAMHAKGEKIAMLTCYDASFAKLMDVCGVDTVLVGDSLGMVLQGHDTTLPVTVEEIAYHTRCVARGMRHAWIVADLPFGSYHGSPDQACRAAATVMQAGAQMVKLEGGGWTADTVRFLVERGIPVCAHLGLTPQSVGALGGYRVQGRDERGAEALKLQAIELSDAGASMMVLELTPSVLAAQVQQAVAMPVIGIGAGPDVAGQVLVLHDMLGITRGKLPRFVRDFMNDAGSIEEALRRYVADVRSGAFPDAALHGY